MPVGVVELAGQGRDLGRFAAGLVAPPAGNIGDLGWGTIDGHDDRPHVAPLALGQHRTGEHPAGEAELSDEATTAATGGLKKDDPR